MRAYVFTYDRPDMLKKVVDHLQANGVNPIVINDGGKLPELSCEVRTHEHRGKREYWKTWQEVITDAKQSPDDIYLFMPDDHLDIDVERIKTINKFMTKKRKQYVYNIVNDGRTECWNRFKPVQFGSHSIQVGFCDCGFFCNRATLMHIRDFKEPPEKRWDDPAISSGVGQQLTTMFVNKKIPCFIPTESLAWHGDHESKMHPEHRKQKPLKSK